MIPHITTQDSVIALASIGNRKYLLASWYLDITKPLIREFMTDTIQYSVQHNYPLIVAVDTNAHSTLYGNDTNKRGEKMEEFIAKHGLRVCNIGTIPTFSATRGNKWATSVIDVTLTSNMDQKLIDWQVLTQFNGSDHRTIHFKIQQETSTDKSKRN
jgi:hypothetical protein